MKYRSRIYYSAEQKNLMWDRWQAGDSLHEIARLLIGATRQYNASSVRPAGYGHRREVARDYL